MLALVAGLLAFAAPAQATHEVVDAVSFFMPEQFLDKDQLSDAFDGSDTAAHLTAVADADATQATFFYCSNFTGAGSIQDPNECAPIGTDTTPNIAGGVHDVAAFDVFWNIPVDTLETGLEYDMVVQACVGPPDPGVGPANCTLDEVEDVHLDDAQNVDPNTGQFGPQLSTGEITGICYTEQTTAAPDQGGVNPNGACTEPNDFQELEHGDIIPADSFTLRFTTSGDVTNASACLDDLADPTNGPEGCDIYADYVFEGPVNTQGTTTEGDDFIVWTAVFTNTGLTKDSDVDVAIFGNGRDDVLECTNDDFVNNAVAGTGPTPNDPAEATPQTFAENICVYDEHYALAQPRATETVGATFDVANADCRTNQDNAETNQLQDIEVVVACLTDQFGTPFVGTVTFESDGVGQILDCGPGNPVGGGVGGTGPTGGANETDSCTTATDANGIASASITSDTVGTQTVTACNESDPGFGTDPFGCAGELRDTVVKTWQTAPSQVRLVFAGTDTGPDPCLTGDKFRENQIGDFDDLLACTYDALGNLVSTEPAENGRLQWFIAPSGGGELTATRFTPNPPNETTQTGTASATIESFRQGNDLITVCLQDDPTANNVAEPECDTVQKRVTESGVVNPQCSDGVDNDADGFIDFPNDPQCESAADNSEAGAGAPQCSDGVDNDGDGLVDFPNDPECLNANDDSETGGPTVGSGACTGFAQGTRTPQLDGTGFVIVGTPSDDVLQGSDQGDIICGLAGADQILGNGGKDQISGGRGNDAAAGGGGNDIVSGDKGRDGLKGNKGIDTLRGRGGADSLQGGRHQDILKGGAGNDSLRGGSGDDQLDGGAD
ncbi:MAG: hypothetical protein LC798_20090, partial [Chloroflexi bacterium]|nr:hypothetical protein [Chloroflexota bacterium]